MRIQCGKILKNLLSKILRSVATLEVLANSQEQLPVINKMRIYCGKFMGSVGIILRVPLKREWYPGLKDCRVLEYDTEQQVYG
jgi:hypothetical protein